MTTAQATTLQDQRIPVGAKIAAAWTSFMFLYAYVDILGFYKPGVVVDILNGKVFTFDISEAWAVTVLSILAVPIFMATLSVALRPRASRLLNLVVPVLYVPFTVFNVVGGSWTYYYGLGVVLELVLLGLIVRYAWTWPRVAPSAALPTSPDRATVRTQRHS